MGRSSLQADSLPELPKKRTFSLPRLRRALGGERQEVAKNAEEMARSAEEAVRAQKAAAWQWYTRGVSEDAKRPPLANSPPSQAPTDSKSGVESGSKGGESISNYRNVLQKKHLQAESPRAASRFKGEAGLTRPTSSSAPTPDLPASSDAPSTPLYDEFELSGLRTQMADFVQRLQHQQTSPAVFDPEYSKPPPDFPPATSVSNDHQQTKAPLPVAAATAGHYPLTKLPPSAVPVASTIPFHMRPFSALHRLLRKVVPGSIMKSPKNSLNSSPAAFEPEVLPEEDDNAQHHYHHYVHHHHHHYHYGQSSEESTATIRSRRRHSENSGIRPHLPSLWESALDDGEEEVDESPINAYLARRRRHSDSFAQLSPKEAAFDEDKGIEGETAKVGLPLKFQKQYKSERFSQNKIPIMADTDLVQPAAAARSLDELDEELVAMKSRRRHSAEMYFREVASLERKAEEAGGKIEGGRYKLGGGAGGGTPLVRRRHSESSRKLEAVQSAMVGRRTPSPGRPIYLQSSSARYLVDGLERHSGVPAYANATHARARSAALRPL